MGNVSAASAFQGMGDAHTEDRLDDLPAESQSLLELGECRLFRARSAAAGLCFLAEVTVVESDKARKGGSYKIMETGLDGEHRDLKLGNLRRMIEAIAGEDIPDDEVQEFAVRMVDDQALKGERFRCEVGAPKPTKNGKGTFTSKVFKPA